MTYADDIRNRTLNPVLLHLYFFILSPGVDALKDVERVGKKTWVHF